MSLRTMERLLIAGSLLLGVTAMGCGDDDDPPSDDSGMDAGEPPQDAGTDARTDARVDSGSDATTGGPSITCGSNSCTGTVIANNPVRPCCVEETDGCGLEAEDIKKASPASPFTGCVPKDVASASASTYCGEFFDQIEPEGDHENGGLDIKSGARYAVFEGCCLSTGECGANITVPRGADAELNSHLGCVSFARLRDAFDAQSEGEDEAPLPDHLPFCNPENGEPPTMGTVPGVGKYVCGCGEGNLYVEGEGLPCLNNLPPAVCGDADPLAADMAKIPEFICGCTANSKLPCLRNLDAATCGNKAIDATSPELAAIPEFICGCTADSKLPCMPNVESTVCGGKAITADSPELNDLPAFICGAVGLTTPPSLPVMPNVEVSICGKKAITADSVELDAIPQFICGRTNNPQAAVLPTMANVDVAVCGKKVMTADSAELNSIPVFTCGAVNNPDTSSLPKLRNVDTAICGKLAVTTGSPFLANVPKFLCGCTNNNAKELGCLRNVEAAVCGAATPIAQVLALVPEFVCGCGLETKDAGVLKLCMSFVDSATCGTKNTVVRDQGTATALDDCLEGVPEYATGCGEEVNTPPVNNPNCLPRAPAGILGCIDIPQQTPALPRVPEYVCGCGNAPTDVAQPFPAYPCLSRVHTTICGAVPISASAQVAGVTNNVCGCGEGQSTASGCVKNVADTICGAIPVCAQCPGGTTCVDTNSDGIGNTCAPP